MKKKLKYYGGQGYGYSKKIGTFKVKANEIKRFTKLSEAKKYYESLDEEKALWDVTNGAELLACHTY